MNRFLKTGSMGMVLCALFLGIAYGAADIPALRDAKDAAERARVQALIDGARKEGKLTIDGTMIEPQMAKYILEGFKPYYGLNDLVAEYAYAGTAQIVTRVDQVLKGNRSPSDIVWNSAWAWYLDLLSRKQIMRYESPYYKEYTISHKVGNSMPGYWVSDSYSFHPMWNVTALAKAGIKDFNPTSWGDFVDPKLAKLICIGNIPKSQSQTAVTIGLRKTLGDEWFKKMAALKPALYVRTAQGRDWSASGEYPIAMFCHAKSAETVKASGVEVRLLYPKEGIVLLPLVPIIMTAALHPNAAKLFIDYVRSKPGTDRVADSAACLLYGRPGVKTPLKEFLPAAEDIKAIPMDWNKEDTPAAVREIQQWIMNIGLSY